MTAHKLITRVMRHTTIPNTAAQTLLERVASKTISQTRHRATMACT